MGVCRQLAHEVGLGNIAEKLREFKIDGLLIVGGFEVRNFPEYFSQGCNIQVQRH